MPIVRCLCLLLATCLSVSLALESFRAENDYETFPSVNGSEYKLYTIHLTWAQALSLCQGDGGGSHLIVINSQEEADIAKEMLSGIVDPTVYGVAVGINDIVTEGTWVTVQGGLVSLSGYNKWGTDQPDGGKTANCGVFDRASEYYDEPCDALYPFICEKPVV